MTPSQPNAVPVPVVWPAQCECGHLFLEKFQWKEPTSDGCVGFCWCGFCRTRRNVYPVGLVGGEG